MPDPGGLLGEIARRKRADVAARLGAVSAAELSARATPTRSSLREALTRPGARFIMEVKKSSPSGSPLREDVDVAAQAAAYAGAADAVSVLTDGPYFGGSLGDLAAARRAFSGPLLAKDFIVDARQVAEARLHGADAVLAILSLLDDGEAAAILHEAWRLGMDVLVEAHDAAEVTRAVALGAALIGINNRDLRDLKTDIAVTELLSPLVPCDRLVVSESGIGSRADVERLGPHADAFLVGTALMRDPRPAQAARALVFGRVKLCGLRDASAAEAAAQCGAAFAGIVMVPGTPRAVAPDRAEPIVEAARRRGLGTVGIFRNAKLIDVALAACRLELDAVQLHGEEDSAYARGLRNLLPAETEIWAAAPVGREVPAPRAGADRILFDTRVGRSSGGTGRSFDWSRVRDRPELASGLLAGGLNAANACAAARVGAWALDVGSGVESAPGRKDPGRMRAFFEALRPASRAETMPC
jgi:indole-3-glycerol phosphate synthase/phosphoribosylanthranilate isomerase